MKGWRPPKATKAPLTAPQMAPSASPATTAKIGGTPATINVADRTAESAAVGPTERSMPPEMMTSVIPRATQALMLDCCRMFMRFRSARNPGAMNAKTARIRSSPTTVPKSRTFTRNPGKECELGEAVGVLIDMVSLPFLAVAA